MDKNTSIGLIVVALIVGGFAGYYLNGSSFPHSGYLRDSANMMQNNGGFMTQMGQRMMSGGQIMAGWGQKYGDPEMMGLSQDWLNNGQMMGVRGQEMTGKSAGITQMMGW